jgi:lipopolysaccharide/colanic/teichoic acid biosynthesis glycosyltransferase
MTKSMEADIMSRMDNQVDNSEAGKEIRAFKRFCCLPFTILVVILFVILMIAFFVALHKLQ